MDTRSARSGLDGSEPWDFVHFDVNVADQVARIEIHHPSRALEQGRHADQHWELLQIFNRLRVDNAVRVVVISGAEDGQFLVPMPLVSGREEAARDMHQDAATLWNASTAIVRLHQTMAELDRPIIAKVNGDAIALGASIVFACDLIIARADARITDNHLGMGEVVPFTTVVGVVPGDGGAALLPLFMSPVKAKEFLMLAREYTGAELAELGAINSAVPADELDGEVDRVVSALLRRSAYALAWTKRVANKHVVDQLNRTLDAGVAYELVNMYQMMVEGKDTLSLE